MLPGNELFDRLYSATQWARDGDGAFDPAPFLSLLEAHRIDADTREAMLRKVGVVEAVVQSKFAADRKAAVDRIDKKGR